MLANHAKDVQKLAITGEPVLSWPARKASRFGLETIMLHKQPCILLTVEMK